MNEEGLKVYSVVQWLDWACPGMLVAVNNEGYIEWIQLNPQKESTRVYADEFYSPKIKFDPGSYKSVKQVA